MAHIAYYRVSSTDQSIDAQRGVLAKGGATFSKEFADEGVSGVIPAMQRQGFAAMVGYVREGDTLHVYAVDRLGRDSIDIQTNVKALQAKGVTVDIHGIGPVMGDTGALIVALLAQLAEMERNKIRERTAAGREVAKAGGKHMGRPASIDGAKAAEALRVLAETGNVTRTAEQFGITRQSLLRLRDSNAKHAKTARAEVARLAGGRGKARAALVPGTSSHE